MVSSTHPVTLFLSLSLSSRSSAVIVRGGLSWTSPHNTWFVGCYTQLPSKGCKESDPSSSTTHPPFTNGRLRVRENKTTTTTTMASVRFQTSCTTVGLWSARAPQTLLSWALESTVVTWQIIPVFPPDDCGDKIWSHFISNCRVCVCGARRSSLVKLNKKQSKLSNQCDTMPDADRQTAMDVETEPYAPSARSPLGTDTWVLYTRHLFIFLPVPVFSNISTC